MKVVKGSVLKEVKGKVLREDDGVIMINFIRQSHPWGPQVFHQKYHCGTVDPSIQSDQKLITMKLN